MKNFVHKEYTEEMLKELQNCLLKFKVKAVKGEGTFEVIASTENVDRDGEVILVKAWQTENFMKNPVLLFGHDYYSLPIGVITSLESGEKGLVAKGIFARTAFAQEVRQLYDDGILKAVSVGFIPLEKSGNTITKAELLELSFVPVPANADALSLSKIQKVVKAFEANKELETDKKSAIEDMKVLLTNENIEKSIKEASYAGLKKDLERFGEKVPELKVYTQYEIDLFFDKKEAVEPDAVIQLLTTLNNNISSNISSTIQQIQELSGEAVEEVDEEGGESEEEPKGQRSLRAKSGRVLSAKNSGIIKNAIVGLGDSIKILKELLELAEGSDESSQEPKKSLIKQAQSLDKGIEELIKGLKGVTFRK